MTGIEKKRVLHFLTQGSIGGQERAQYQLFRAFNNDDEIEVAAAMGRSEGIYTDLVKELKIPVIELNMSSGFDIRFDKRRLQEIRQFQIHHLHDPSPNHILLSVLSGKNIKRVFTRRGGIIDYSRNGLKKRMKFFITKLFLKMFIDSFSGNTQTAAEFVRTYYNIDRRIHVLYNGIDFGLLSPDKEKNVLLKELKLDPNDYTVGTACQLVGLKRVDLLIRAFSLCGVNNKKLLIFGKGLERDSLKTLVSSLGLDDQVFFVGEVPDMMNYYQVLDCFVLASGREESFGNAVVEAMFLKVPSIVMEDAMGLREHIADQVTGFVAADERDLGRQMEYVHRNPDAAQKVAEKASEYVESKYSIENMKIAYKEFYKEVL